jgi:uracil-DNA glycosylase
MRVTRIGLSCLPLAGVDIDGHPFKGRRGGSRNRFFAERKGEINASRYARIEQKHFIILPTNILIKRNRAPRQVREGATEHGDAGNRISVISMSKDFVKP